MAFSMRRVRVFALGLLGLASTGVLGACGTPLAAAALPMVAQRPKDAAVAVPNEDGSVYVLVESSFRSADLLKRAWHRKAKELCEGEFMVLSESAGARKTQGSMASRMHEGFVRCLSPESTQMAAQSASN